MSKIWVVLRDNCDVAWVAGVFDNEEDAVEACRIFPGSCEMDCYDLNALPEHPPGTIRFGVSLDKNGEVLHSWREDPLWPTPSVSAVVKWLMPEPGYASAQAIKVILWAKDKKEAKEQAKAAARKELDNG